VIFFTLVSTSLWPNIITTLVQLNIGEVVSAVVQIIHREYLVMILPNHGLRLAYVPVKEVSKKNLNSFLISTFFSSNFFDFYWTDSERCPWPHKSFQNWSDLWGHCPEVSVEYRAWKLPPPPARYAPGCDIPRFILFKGMCARSWTNVNTWSYLSMWVRREWRMLNQELLLTLCKYHRDRSQNNIHRLLRVRAEPIMCRVPEMCPCLQGW
jgi:hypothetical protein